MQKGRKERRSLRIHKLPSDLLRAQLHPWLRCTQHSSSEFTNNNRNDQYDQDCYDRDCHNLVGSHPIKLSVVWTCLAKLPEAWEIPSRHALQRLITPICISFALEQCAARVLDRLSLPAKIGKRIATDIFRLQSYPLTLP